jgi:hypothetical protein
MCGVLVPVDSGRVNYWAVVVVACWPVGACVLCCWPVGACVLCCWPVGAHVLLPVALLASM